MKYADCTIFYQTREYALWFADYPGAVPRSTRLAPSNWFITRLPENENPLEVSVDQARDLTALVVEELFDQYCGGLYAAQFRQHAYDLLTNRVSRDLRHLHENAPQDKKAAFHKVLKEIDTLIKEYNPDAQN